MKAKLISLPLGKADFGRSKDLGFSCCLISNRYICSPPRLRSKSLPLAPNVTYVAAKLLSFFLISFCLTGRCPKILEWYLFFNQSTMLCQLGTYKSNCN